MELILKGNGWHKECKCNGSGFDGIGCGSTLRVYKKDLFRITTSDYSGETTQRITFQCIVCGKLNIISNYPGNLYDYPIKRNYKVTFHLQGVK